ncbi:MAG: sensor histidine kinase [Mastigocoleus sp.]
MIFKGQHQEIVRKKTSSENHLYEFSLIKRLTSSFKQKINDFPGLLQLIVQEVVQIIGSDGFCFILLNHSQSCELELVAQAGVKADELSLFGSDGAEYEGISQVFLTGKSHLIQQENVNFQTTQTKTGLSPSYMYAVGIESSSGKNLGVFSIGSWDILDTLDEHTQNFVETLVEIAAIAIENAILIKSAKEREALLIQENEMLQLDNLQLEKNKHQTQLQNLELLEATQLKSQFLSTTSHELRTPLNVILGLSQVLLRQRTSNLSEQQVEIIQRILNNGNHLLALIDDMLCFAKIEAGRLSFQQEEFNLQALMIGVVDEYRPKAERKYLSLNTHIKLDNPLVKNDKIRLKQLLSKILQNAIKFTEVGDIDIKVWEIDSDKIAIAVQDTGIGIAEYDLEQIFEKFWQVDQSSTRKYAGTGLGLAIAKSLVEIMEGSIFISSKINQGSIFRIELPRYVKCKGCI